MRLWIPLWRLERRSFPIVVRFLVHLPRLGLLVVLVLVLLRVRWLLQEVLVLLECLLC